MSKLRPPPRAPSSSFAHDASEAPTLEWDRPSDLNETPTPTQTARVRKLSISVPVQRGPSSGLRAALTPEEIERYELREKRETLPAPADVPEAPTASADPSDDPR